MERATLPDYVKALTGILCPVLSVLPILYRSSLLRHVRREARICLLFIVGAAIYASTVGFWFVIALILFATGVVSPD